MLHYPDSYTENKDNFQMELRMKYNDENDSFNDKNDENENNSLSSSSSFSSSSSMMLSRRKALASAAASFVAISNLPTVSNAATSSLSSTITTTSTTSTLLSTAAKATAASTTSSLTTIQETISGFVSGATITTAKTFVKYPLDTASVRLQMKSTSYSINNINSILELFKGSYNGITTPLVSNIPAGAVFFAIKDATKSIVKGTAKDNGVLLPKWVSTVISVGVALPPYWLLRNPSEVIKTRQQIGITNTTTIASTSSSSSSSSSSVSAWEAFQIIQQKNNNNTMDSIKELYTGYNENVLYSYPADIIKFVAYEALSSGKKKEKVTPLEGALYGAGATAIAQFVTTPLDVVRNRVMADTTTKADDTTNLEKKKNSMKEKLAIKFLNKSSENDEIRVTPPPQEVKKSYIETLTTLAKEEGLSGLFAGATPRVGKAILSGAIQFAAYEETKESIRKLFEKQS